MLGAAASAFYINDAASILPRAVVAKARGYLAGAAADVLEVGSHSLSFSHLNLAYFISYLCIHQTNYERPLVQLLISSSSHKGRSENRGTPGGSSEDP